MNRLYCCTAYLFLLAVLLNGCAFASTPTFNVDSFAITDRSETATVLNITLLGTNQSNTPLQLRTITYSLELQGMSQVSATRQAQTTLPANGQQTLTLPIVLTDAAFLAIVDKEIPYQFHDLQ